MKKFCRYYLSDFDPQVRTLRINVEDNVSVITTKNKAITKINPLLLLVVYKVPSWH